MSEEAKRLTAAFDAVLVQKFGQIIPPIPYSTPFGVRTLDCLLGGGLSSSLPVCVSSTPESGKSTFAFQFCSQFLRENEDAVAVYLDIENAAASVQDKGGSSRIVDFGIETSRFMYKPIVANLEQVFNILEDLVSVKKRLEEATKREFRLLFVWDSIASTSSSKDSEAEDVNKVIGFKARELTFLISKYKPLFAMNRVTMIIIDQIRANMKIDGPYAKSEKSVGEFADYKAASNITSLHHAYSQWLFLSKGSRLSPNEPMGVDGWILNIHIEKNKNTQSGYSVSVLFDKKYGIIPILSEYYFLSNMTPWEQRITKKAESKLIYPLLASGDAKSKQINLVNPDTGEIIVRSDRFSERNLIEKYNTDADFRKIFDAAVNMSVEQRIKKGMLRSSPVALDEIEESVETE
jgi:RecA/RadA recombinase